ncbi:MAG: flagellar hook-associated protein FlgL [Burkholderiales bacterium]|nr:flagellar hook-associated protein FlgL [Burkholderiales bacterium]
MRIASFTAYQSTLANLQARQQDLSTIQNQMTSGLRVQVASDDPVAAAQVVRAAAAQSRITAQTTAANASQTEMQQTDSALGNAANLILQARNLIVSAGNGSYTDSDRANIATQLQGLQTDLFSIANTSNGNGRYLFGGQGSDTAPFVQGANGAVSYVGIAGQQTAASSQALPLTVDGNVWMNAADPGNPGSTISVFQSLQNTITALNTPGQSAAQIAATVKQGLASLDAGANLLSSARAAVGSAENAVTNVTNQLSAGMLASQTQQSNAQDLDMTAAISNFSTQQTGYQAALKTYSMIQQLSLFNYISPSSS